MTQRALLTLEDASKIYARPAGLLKRLRGNTGPGFRAVDGVSLSIAEGETYGLVGESGCGKSTLGRMIAGLVPPTSGRIAFSPSSRHGGRPRLQMIFQDPFSSLNGRWRVADLVAEPIVVNRLRVSRAEIRDRVEALLVQVGLSAADAPKVPQQFSGGQRQRISIARALAGEPDFLILDEPTSALDVSVQAQVLNLLRDLQRDLGLTSLFITHNLSVVRIMADRIGVMYRGEIVEEAPAEALFRTPRHPYTRLLIDAAPDLDTSDRSLHPIKGEVPGPSTGTRGCRFHVRCPFATPRCASEAPLLRFVEPVARTGCHYDLDLSRPSGPPS
jgi:peptide/nickel transport system ATP-binding protein